MGLGRTVRAFAAVSHVASTAAAPRAAHPQWLDRRLELVTRSAARRHRLIGTADVRERIGLADQARQFGQRIALGSSQAYADRRRDHSRHRREKVYPDIDQSS